MKYCRVCGEVIPEGRLKVLPNAVTCVNHSNVEKKLGFQVVTGKDTYTELNIVDAETFQKLSALERKNFGQGLQM